MSVYKHNQLGWLKVSHQHKRCTKIQATASFYSNYFIKLYTYYLFLIIYNHSGNVETNLGKLEK